MRRSTAGLIATIAFTVIAGPVSAGAQQPAKVPRIGFLSSDVPTAASHLVEAFQQGLHDLGYAEGQNIVIVYRFAQGNFNRLPDLAADLVRLKVNVIVAVSTAAAQAPQHPEDAIEQLVHRFARYLRDVAPRQSELEPGARFRRRPGGRMEASLLVAALAVGRFPDVEDYARGSLLHLLSQRGVVPADLLEERKDLTCHLEREVVNDECHGVPPGVRGSGRGHAPCGRNFAHSVTFGGDDLVVGMTGDDDHGLFSGSVYVFSTSTVPAP